MTKKFISLISVFCLAITSFAFYGEAAETASPSEDTEVPVTEVQSLDGTWAYKGYLIDEGVDCNYQSVNSQIVINGNTFTNKYQSGREYTSTLRGVSQSLCKPSY